MKELDAMQAIAKAFEDLNNDEIKRVLKWALDKFEIKTEDIHEAETNEKPSSAQEEQLDDFDSIADFYYKISPSTDAEKALTVGYWLQEIEGSNNFDSYSVNSELKHLGHQVSNITRAFNQLMDKNPQLAVQTQKSGNTKQARKKYKLTTAGIRHVNETLTM